MSGTKGKSGGSRTGAGRKRTKDPLVGALFVAVRHHPNGQFEMLATATIAEVSANLIVIALADGGSIRLVR